MKTLALIATSGILAAGIVALSSSRSLLATPSSASEVQAAPAQASSTTSVSVTKGADDGKSVFHFMIYPPWAGAEKRVIAFYGGSVSKSGLASLTGSRLTDLGSGSEALQIIGESYTCTARLSTGLTWRDVDAKTEFQLEIAPIPPDQH